MYIAALRLNIPAMSVLSAAKQNKLIENQKQRAIQGARRGYEWAEAITDAEANDRDVVTPPLAAAKSARRLWQRAKSHAKEIKAAEGQNEQARSQRGPASAEPAGTSSWEASSAFRSSVACRLTNKPAWTDATIPTEANKPAWTDACNTFARRSVHAQFAVRGSTHRQADV